MAPRAFAAPAAVDTREVAHRVLERGLAEIDLGLYPGSLLLQGMSELASIGPDRDLLARTVALYGKFATKEIKVRGNFISYEVGGGGAAYLCFRGFANGLAAQVADGAGRLMAQQRRSSEGLFVPPRATPDKDQVFIDVAFAVTPFLLYAGQVERRDDYIDQAVSETLERIRILRDRETGLLHQGRGFQGKNVVSQDNWCRGNGWGAVGLAALVRDLPTTHPRRQDVEAVAREFFAAVLRHQDTAGLWHQEMTDVTSYTETSGSGLLLYGLGVALETGLIDRRHEADLKRGLGGLTAYIAADGAVGHACTSCLCPGQGTKEDYKSRPWAHNDPHAFGAVVLAYAQAAKLGLRHVAPVLNPGCFAVAEDSPGKPRTYVRYNPAGGQNVAWENDRVAFRVYGPAVRDRVGSGIDVWVKSVDFPVIDKWYRLATEGFDYHADRGEGGDFYEVGNLRGCGGSAVWREGRPCASPTYGTQRIVTNEPGGIEFVLEFEPWDAAGIRVAETKRIRMLPGTQFFQVVSTLTADGSADLTVGIGLTTFGQPVVKMDAAQGRLSAWEKIRPDRGALGTVVVVDPKTLERHATTEKEEFVLVRAKSGQPFSYFVGAGWEGSARFKAPGSWDAFLRQEAAWTQLTAFYARKEGRR